MHGMHKTKLDQQNRTGQAIVTFQNRRFEPFNLLKKLVPQNCMIGTFESIPGLISHDPNSID